MKEHLENVHRAFPDESDLRVQVESIIWPAGPRCPYCLGFRPTPMHEGRRKHCNRCNTSFSLTTGTFLAGTHLDLRKWIAAINIMLTRPAPEHSARRLAASLDINRNTACRISNAIHYAKQTHPWLIAQLHRLATKENAYV